ncbi:MAG: molybdopterin molybdotransferase MoeA, partial [Rhodospirillaceae bacterium]|nr:molybdopterin molybdotransferase MoeA [Rhodospirillaceae bacterium]
AGFRNQENLRRYVQPLQLFQQLLALLVPGDENADAAADRCGVLDDQMIERFKDFVRAGLDRGENLQHLLAVGEAPAGGFFEGRVGTNQAVRIFTGGPVPDGADAVVIQEVTSRDGECVTIEKTLEPGKNIRPMGQDFKTGDTCLKAGTLLSPRHIGLAAAMNVVDLPVHAKPRIAILSTGNELVAPGGTPGQSQIIGSNGPALAAFITDNGGEAIDLGIAPDDPKTLGSMAEKAKGCDFFVTTGGVSVGDHDIIQEVLKQAGLEVNFWGVAMRPGKPLLFGHIGPMPFLGFPGNPVSTMVCAVIFLKPAMAVLCGTDKVANPVLTAKISCDLRQNDAREDYVRARLTLDDEGTVIATPFSRQDSAMISVLGAADALIRRMPHAPAVQAGAMVSILPLSNGLPSKM